MDTSEEIYEMQVLAARAYQTQDFRGAIAALTRLIELDTGNADWVEGRAQAGWSLAPAPGPFIPYCNYTLSGTTRRTTISLYTAAL